MGWSSAKRRDALSRSFQIQQRNQHAMVKRAAAQGNARAGCRGCAVLRPTSMSNSERLEELWTGDFGDAYTQRNSAAADCRQPFWDGLFNDFPCRRVLEVGCNLGANLKWVSTNVAANEVYGVDINESALAQLRGAIPAVNPVWGRARELPFRDRYFDMVFTMGVLIHQPPEALPIVMSEIVRCSRKYVLAGEYFSETPVDVA